MEIQKISFSLTNHFDLNYFKTGAQYLFFKKIDFWNVPVHLLLHFWSWQKSTLFNGQLSFERDNFHGNSKANYKTKTNKRKQIEHLRCF